MSVHATVSLVAPSLALSHRQGLAYQSTNCSMSQLYRYLINYKRAIAAAARHRPTLRGSSTLSGWFLLHATLITTPLLDFSIAVTVTTVFPPLFVIRRHREESLIVRERPSSKIVSNPRNSRLAI